MMMAERGYSMYSLELQIKCDDNNITKAKKLVIKMWFN